LFWFCFDYLVFYEKIDIIHDMSEVFTEKFFDMKRIHTKKNNLTKQKKFSCFGKNQLTYKIPKRKKSPKKEAKKNKTSWLVSKKRNNLREKVFINNRICPCAQLGLICLNCFYHCH